MLTILTDFIADFWYSIVAVAVLCSIACYFSPTFYGYLKKGLLFLLAVLVISSGYELVTSRSILTIPGRIDTKLSEKPTKLEPSHHYYREEQLPKDVD